MSVLRALARPMLASIFIVQGYDTFRRPERVAAQAEPVVRPLAERIPAVPAKTEQAVRLNGAVQLVAGSLLALGKFPRLSALAIAGTLVPTTLAGHRFWEEEDGASQAQQRIHFLKNLSLFGGLLIAAADTGGRPSLAWRARYAAKTARRETALATWTARATGKTGFKAAKGGAKTAGLGAKAGAKTAGLGAKAGAKTARLGAKTAKSGAKAGAGVKAARSGAKAVRPAARAATSGAKAGAGVKAARSGAKAVRAGAGKLGRPR